MRNIAVSKSIVKRLTVGISSFFARFIFQKLIKETQLYLSNISAFVSKLEMGRNIYKKN